MTPGDAFTPPLHVDVPLYGEERSRGFSGLEIASVDWGSIALVIAVEISSCSEAERFRLLSSTVHGLTWWLDRQRPLSRPFASGESVQ